MRQLVEMGLSESNCRGSRGSNLRQEVVALVRDRGYEHREEPFKLASGQLSHDYVDGKYAVGDGARLRIACDAAIETASELGITFNAVGGITMGADALTHGIALMTECAWFSVRKEPKPRGRQQWIEGARLAPGHRVLLVDDVVTTGGSILKAYDHVLETGASVVGVIAMVDRGDSGARLFKQFDIPYAALVTYHDLGIKSVGGTPLVTSTR
jgi:orotate phosphoribosyltransferase